MTNGTEGTQSDQGDRGDRVPKGAGRGQGGDTVTEGTGGGTEHWGRGVALTGDIEEFAPLGLGQPLQPFHHPGDTLDTARGHLGQLWAPRGLRGHQGSVGHPMTPQLPNSSLTSHGRSFQNPFRAPQSPNSSPKSYGRGSIPKFQLHISQERLPEWLHPQNSSPKSHGRGSQSGSIPKFQPQIPWDTWQCWNISWMTLEKSWRLWNSCCFTST